MNCNMLPNLLQKRISGVTGLMIGLTHHDRSSADKVIESIFNTGSQRVSNRPVRQRRTFCEDASPAKS